MKPNELLKNVRLRDCGQIASFKVCACLFPMDESCQNHDTVRCTRGPIKRFSSPSNVISVKLCQLKHAAGNSWSPFSCDAKFLYTYLYINFAIGANAIKNKCISEVR